MSVIPAPRRLRQEDIEFKDSLGYVMRPCVKQTKKYGYFSQKEPFTAGNFI
jgi:hypothetical protein